LSRLLEADYNSGAMVYTYGYDPAGNLVNKNATTRTYNELNQMISAGSNTYQYDGNGNLISDGQNTYIWDEANRMTQVTMPFSQTQSYQYDGNGNRIGQSYGSTFRTTTQTYLNDVQPGLTRLLRQTTDIFEQTSGFSTEVNDFVHGPRGIQRKRDDTGNWLTYMQDGLGSVRGLVDNGAQVQSSMSYTPYGQPQGSYGAGFGFTGEETDPNGQIYLRARYYNPNIGIFSALDPWEGVAANAMSLNGYSWVEGNVPNFTDPSGQITEADCNRTNLDALPDDVQIKCDYARRLNEHYPESGGLEYWLRFQINGLRSMWQNRTLDDVYAFVPTNFVPDGNKETLALDILRRIEDTFDRPLTFDEILAMVIVSEFSVIISTNAQIPTQPYANGNSAAGRTITEFKAALEEAGTRHFHGQCRRVDANGTVSGVCGAERLIRRYLGQIQGWYDHEDTFEGYESWLSTAQDWRDLGGIVGGGTCGRPFNWGNIPNENIPLPNDGSMDYPQDLETVRKGVFIGEKPIPGMIYACLHNCLS
jgi:RHS repeat-associated protein